VVEPEIADPRQKLTTIVYQKGAWVLHMLRRRVGDGAFFRSMRTYYQRHAGGNVTTTDLRRHLEAETGESLETFFHQWLRRSDVPELDVTWTWDPTRQEAIVAVEQVQGGAPYRTPLDLRFAGPDGKVTRTITLETARDVVRFRLKAPLSGLEVDPDGWLLHVATVTEARTPAERARLGHTGAHRRHPTRRGAGR
jgi:aminopeptidase N